MGRGDETPTTSGTDCDGHASSSREPVRPASSISHTSETSTSQRCPSRGASSPRTSARLRLAAGGRILLATAALFTTLFLSTLPPTTQAFALSSSPFSGAYRSRSVQASPPDKLMQQHCDSTLLSETYQVIRVGQHGLEFRSGYSAPTMLGSGLGDEEPLALAYSSFHGYFTGRDIFAGAFHGSTKCTGQFLEGRAILYCPVAHAAKARCILSFECFAGPCYDPNYVAPMMGRHGATAPSYLQVLWRRLGFLGCATVLGVGLSGVLVAMCVQWFADRTTNAAASGASAGVVPVMRHSSSVSKLSELTSATAAPETSKPPTKRIHRRGKSDLGTIGGVVPPSGLEAPLLPGARDDPSLDRLSPLHGGMTPAPISMAPPPPPPPGAGMHAARSLPFLHVATEDLPSPASPTIVSAPHMERTNSMPVDGVTRSLRSDANLNKLLLDHLEREKQAFLQAAERARHGDASALEGFSGVAAPRPVLSSSNLAAADASAAVQPPPAPVLSPPPPPSLQQPPSSSGNSSKSGVEAPHGSTA
ncbi:hypothetical protein RI054_13g65870 [Pseudoscourfieldia marina]